jgi:hypothetical protein
MGMTHHNANDYNTSASAAAQHARTLFEKELDAGKARASDIIMRVLNEVPQDRIVKAPALAFDVEVNGEIGVTLSDSTRLLAVPHAVQQIAERAGIPKTYVDSLREADTKSAADPYWRMKLLATNLATQYAHRGDEKYLLRSYESNLRGFLSDKFRRLDSRPLLDAFAKAASAVGAVPWSGLGSQVKTLVRIALPHVFEPIPNEPMLVGLSWQNSDYGSGAHEIKLFVYRPWCTNLAMLESALRQVHLGKRLDENMDFSQKTYSLDTATIASAVTDVVGRLLEPAYVHGVMNQIKELGSEKIDTGKVIADLAIKLGKGGAARVAEVFNSAEVELLPPGNTAWRMSNALSLLATREDDLEKKLELERLAGSFFKKAA